MQWPRLNISFAFVILSVLHIDIPVYTPPAKNMEYFYFIDLFAFLWGLQGVSVL